MNDSQLTLRELFALTAICSLGWAVAAAIRQLDVGLAVTCAAAWTVLIGGFVCIREGAPPVAALGTAMVCLATIMGVLAGLSFLSSMVTGFGVIR